MGERMPSGKAIVWPTPEQMAAAIKQAVSEERKRCLMIADKEISRHCTGSGFDSQPARNAAERIKSGIIENGE